MVNSMTGFAAANGEIDGWRWGWELRGVNARGLDLRLRLPDWIGGLEPAVRAELKRALARGSINLALRVSRDDGVTALALDEAALNATLAALKRIETAALDHNLQMAPPSSADVLAMRGVLQSGDAGTGDTGQLQQAILAGLPDLIADFAGMRAAEGAALATVLTGQLGTIEALVADAMQAANARACDMAQNLRINLARVLDNSDGADADRVAVELAMLAVKSDIREELDRLEAHVLAARALLAATGPVGRKLDFLMQEFNREANTLCSKAQASALTRIGLDLKATIDQMREQVQNVE